MDHANARNIENGTKVEKGTAIEIFELQKK
jgi:hypothetical protein